MIAVMGAAGNVGSKVADALLRRNEAIRVLEHGRSLEQLRSRGAEVVKGDALNLEELRSFLKEAQAALVLLPENIADPEFVANRSRMSRAIVGAIRDSRVGHVVALSTVGAGQEDAPGPPAGLREFEGLLTGLESTNVLVLRSALYMDYLLASLPLIQSQKVNGSAVDGDLKLPMVATRDVAAEAAERLARRDFAGHQVKLLLGPEDVSFREATEIIGSLLGIPDLPYVQFPPAGVRDALVGAGMSQEVASLMVEMQASLNEGRQFGNVRRTSESTTPTRLEDFLRESLSPARV